MNTYTNFASESAEASGGFGALGIDAKAFLIQFVTFILVFIVLKKFVFQPIVNVLEARKKAIDDGLRLTNELTAEKEKLEAEVAKVSTEARKRADEVIAASKDQADAMIKEAEASAQTKADRILQEAKKKIDQEVISVRRAVEKEAVELVIKATEIVAAEKIDAKKDQELIAHAIKEQSK